MQTRWLTLGCRNVRLMFPVSEKHLGFLVKTREPQGLLGTEASYRLLKTPLETTCFLDPSVCFTFPAACVNAGVLESSMRLIPDIFSVEKTFDGHMKRL